MARGFKSMSRQQLSKFISDRMEYVKCLEQTLHSIINPPTESGTRSGPEAASGSCTEALNKTIVGDDVVMAQINNDWRVFDDVHGTMKELNRQRCILLRAHLEHEKMCPHDPLTLDNKAQDDEHKKDN